MKTVLMNKDIPVAEIDIHEKSGRIREIVREINPEYLPVIVLHKPDKEDALQYWLKTRCIPDTRDGLSGILKKAGVDNSYLLSIKNLGLNLTDQYWFKLEAMDLTWEHVNLFENDFLSNEFFHAENNDISYSPDASSNGELPKKWVIKNKERYLLKEGTAPYFQQPYNECIASRILSELQLPHVEYTLEKIGDKTYSSCKTFITPETEYVPALYIKDCRKKLNHESDYQHFINCMEKMHIPCSQKDLDRILAFDFLITNNDRHYGNFGFIREVKTLKFLSLAPIFDNGNSLWYRELTSQIKFSEQESKPFQDTHEKQIKKISDVGFDLNRISMEKVHKICSEVFMKNMNIDAERVERISSGIIAHINQLERSIKRQIL